MEGISLTRSLKLIKDIYARSVGEWILGSEGRDIVLVPDQMTLWSWIRSCGGLELRIAYRCLNGIRRDIQGRQGVWNSRQDGPLTGNGHSMTVEGYSFGFWTCCFNDEEQLDHDGVNNGSGLGYRTLLTSGVLAVRVGRIDYVTIAGCAELRRKGAIK